MSTVRTLLVAVVLACLIIPSASFAESDEASMFAQARSHFQESNYYFASTWLERILKKFPATPQREEVLMMLAKSYAATSRDEKAIRTLKTLLKDFPKAAGKLEPGLLKLVQEPAEQAPQLAEPAQPAAASVPAAETAPVTAAAPPPTSVAAEQAAADKTAADKEIAEKVAAHRVAAQRVAAETAAAEKAAAEKAAARKESVEKAVAREESVEKATADRAAAIKAAVEKAAAEKAAAVADKPAAEAPAEPAKAAAVSEPAVKPAPTPVEAAPVVVAAPSAAPPAPIAAPAEVPEPPKLASIPSEPVLQSAPASAAAVGTIYTLEFGTFVLKSEMVEINKKIKRAGMKPVVEPGPRKKQQMSRIHVGEYADQKSAEKMLQKLRKAKAEQFILQDKTGKFTVYAGSYFDKLGAVDEQLRLAGFGITTELRQISVQVPTFVLTAGSFKSQEAAAQKGAELERLGVKPTVVQRPSAK